MQTFYGCTCVFAQITSRIDDNDFFLLPGTAPIFIDVLYMKRSQLCRYIHSIMVPGAKLIPSFTPHRVVMSIFLNMEMTA